jgi:predicted ATPase/DNA-binding CsgD family transcriptional regulator
MRYLVPNNLPAPVTSFVGRAEEIHDVLGRLDGRTRLVTLTGIGGVGKTRLAQEIAWRLLETDSLPDGVWWVELAPLTDPRRLAQAVASTLGLQEEPDRPFAEILCAALRTRRLLLVLDNCEHLVHAAAQLVYELLRAAPTVSILATSREPLKVDGEIERSVPPLTCPESGDLIVLERLREFDAVRLFADRATGASDRFQLSERTAPAVARVCQQLDGIPLALELAAARIRVLSVDQIAARLDDCFGVLAEGSRTAPRRQRTLESAVAWSYDLLPASEQQLFNRLAVFRGGWTLEAAEAICGDPSIGLVLDTLGRLVEKSLVVAEDGGYGANRYRMPETIRQFAAARLLASGEAPLLRQRHFRWFVQLGLEAEQGIRFGRLPWSIRKRWVERIQIEMANLRAAWQWPLEGDGSPRLGLELAAGLFALFWTGLLSEGIDCYTAVLERDRGSGPSPERSWALATACKLAAEYGSDALSVRWAEEYWAQPVDLRTSRGNAFVLKALSLIALRRGDTADARSRAVACIQECRAGGDMQALAIYLAFLGTVAEVEGQLGEAEAAYAETVEMAREDDFPIALGLGLAGLGRLAHRRGEHASAREVYHHAQQALVDMGAMPQIAQLLADLGRLELDCGNWSEAASRYGESLETAIRVGADEAEYHALRGLGLALVWCDTGVAPPRHVEAGLRLLGACQSVAVNSPVEPAALSRGALLLGEARPCRLVEEGRALGLDDAIALARAALSEHGRSSSSASAIEGGGVKLSRREQEVAALLARGASNRQIADSLVIAERTAEMHVSNILAKLGLSARAQVAAWAAEQRTPAREAAAAGRH